jgi:hypothetical protein
MGIYDGQIDPDPPEIDECPECEQIHHYRDTCPEIPLAETHVYGVRVTTTETAPGEWQTVVDGGDWDCVTGDHQDREEALAHYDRVVDTLLAKTCPGGEQDVCTLCRPSS